MTRHERYLRAGALDLPQGEAKRDVGLVRAVAPSDHVTVGADGRSGQVHVHPMVGVDLGRGDKPPGAPFCFRCAKAFATREDLEAAHVSVGDELHAWAYQGRDGKFYAFEAR